MVAMVHVSSPTIANRNVITFLTCSFTLTRAAPYKF